MRFAKMMEDRDLPIPIEAFGRKGEIIAIRERTKHTRSYQVSWDDGSTQWYKGAATRPHWIRHIGKGVKETTLK